MNYQRLMTATKMMFWMFIVAAMVLVTSMVYADTELVFTWDANSETDLEGYRLYQSTVSRPHTLGDDHELVGTIPTGTETFTLTVEDGTYFWYVTAFDTDGNESGLSNEVTYTADSIAPEPPGNLLISSINKIIAALEDIKRYLAVK